MKMLLCSSASSSNRILWVMLMWIMMVMNQGTHNNIVYFGVAYAYFGVHPYQYNYFHRSAVGSIQRYTSRQYDRCCYSVYTSCNTIPRFTRKRNALLQLHLSTTTLPSNAITSNKSPKTITALSTPTNITATTAATTKTISSKSTIEIRNELLQLLFHDNQHRNNQTTAAIVVEEVESNVDVDKMSFTDAELQRIQQCINILEENYVPCHTISFYNLLQYGSWKYLFTTKYMNRTSSNTFRIVPGSIQQSIQSSRTGYNNHNNVTMSSVMNYDSINGTITNSLTWEYHQHQEESQLLLDHSSINTNNSNGNNNAFLKWFDCYGTYTISTSYRVLSNGRVVLTLDDDDDDNGAEAVDSMNTVQRTIQLLPQSTLPRNVTLLMKYIQHYIPKELQLINVNNVDEKIEGGSSINNNSTTNPFMGYDVTYMDEQLRIIRYTGSSYYDGIRNIFVRAT